MEPKTLRRTFAIVACLAAWAVRHLLQQDDSRTPEWLRTRLRTRWWDLEQALCRPAIPCEIGDADLWTPENTSLTVDGLYNFFNTKSPEFQFKIDAVAASVHKRYLARRRGSQGALLQIGPNKLNDEELRNLAVWNLAAANSEHVVLVEPQEPIMDTLQEQANRLRLKPSRLHVINAALCPDTSENLTLYKFRPESAPTRPDISMWSTLGGRDVLMNTWRRNSLMGEWPMEERHLDDEVLASFIVGVPVKCHTASSLLEDVGLKPFEVDFLMIDAEGYDAEILAQFTALADFNPAAIIIEYGFHHASRGKLHLVTQAVRDWARRGYNVHKHHDNLVFYKLQK